MGTYFIDILIKTKQYSFKKINFFLQIGSHFVLATKPYAENAEGMKTYIQAIVYECGWFTILPLDFHSIGNVQDVYS